MKDKKKSLHDIEEIERHARIEINNSIRDGEENTAIEKVQAYFAIKNKYATELSLYRDKTSRIMQINTILWGKESELTRYQKWSLFANANIVVIM